MWNSHRLLILLSLLVGMSAGCNDSKGGKADAPWVGKNSGLLDSFDALPPDVNQAVNVKNTVWAVEGFYFIGLGLTKDEKSTTYLIFRDGKLVSFVSKTNSIWLAQRRNNRSVKEYATHETHQAGEFTDGGGQFKWRVKGKQTG